jgi:hypothetical protein
MCPPQLTKFLGGRAHGVVEGVGLGELLVERGERALALDCVVLSGDVAKGADRDPVSGFWVGCVVEADGDPQPVPVAVVHRDREVAVLFGQQFGER